MNVSFLRVMIVIALGAANLFGLMPLGYAGASVVKVPSCGMECCSKGGCECLATPLDVPTQPAPIVPMAVKQAVKYVPMLLAIFPAPVADSTLIPALPPANAGRLQALAAPMFRLHCAMLM